MSENVTEGGFDAKGRLCEQGNGKGKLLHLSDYGPIQADRIISEMRSYWNGLREGRAIPARADIDPSGIRRAIEHAFILERIAPGAARFRLAGRHLNDLMGMEVRGMPICAFLNTSSRGRLSDVLESVFKGPQIAEISLVSVASYGRPALGGKMIILPLRSDLGDVSRALGCLVAEGEIGQSPRRFDLVGDQVIPLIPGAMVVEPSASTVHPVSASSRWQPLSARKDAQPQPAPTPQEPASPAERRARFRVVSRNDTTPQTHIHS
ncbi:PAS domain-containing protein [Paracoccus sp. MBLB3053]|uniref:PAS domain-containing protein n=1 Tax=Paracoccus aurantius TaxID=3073814 RepID=A0ABU2HSN0_9RHOB|nr:PAS domain-containing protein [Paracoccus sp. MBLB3053]MDS9468055.1 PAS domain-containing protein [Paracoccus sp. MBLB3053]